MENNNPLVFTFENIEVVKSTNCDFKEIQKFILPKPVLAEKITIPITFKILPEDSLFTCSFNARLEDYKLESTALAIIAPEELKGKEITSITIAIRTYSDYSFSGEIII